jgi:MFS family permease
VLVGSQIMLNVGVSQVVPVLPVFAAQMGLGATGIGLLISAPPLARLALNMPLGRLCDTMGRLPLMRYGTLVTATGAIGTGLFMPHGLLAVLPFRLLIGAGSGASMAGSSAMMADLTDRAPQHRATIMGFQSMVLSAVRLQRESNSQSPDPTRAA